MPQAQAMRPSPPDAPIRLRPIGMGKPMSSAGAAIAVIVINQRSAAGAPAGAQMKDILGRIDGLLGEAGSDKSKILSATIWLADMRDFDTINEAWDAWVSPGNAPARACVEAKLAFTKFTVEVGVIAAR